MEEQKQANGSKVWTVFKWLALSVILIAAFMRIAENNEWRDLCLAVGFYVILIKIENIARHLGKIEEELRVLSQDRYLRKLLGDDK